MEKARKNFKIILIFALVLLMNFGFFGSLLAYVMNSGNYKMEVNDSITNLGENATSANYIFRDTMGEVSTGRSSSATYSLRAGYLEMLENYISISSPSDASLTPDIPGITGGTGDASVAWNVIADNPSGFNMRIKASTTPAMKLDGSYYFDDYTPASAGVPDYSWSVASNNAEFGFTVEPATAADTVANFLDNGSSACNTGSSNTAYKCWLNFNGTTYVNAINRTTRTSPTGESESIKFRAQSAAKFLKEGSYSATVTVLVAAN